jgi:hypothetical protein
MKTGLKREREHFPRATSIAPNQRRADGELESGRAPKTQGEIRGEFEVGYSSNAVRAEEALSAPKQ